MTPDQYDVVQRLEAERARPVPPPSPRTDELFAELLDLISAECRRAGMLPKRWPASRSQLAPCGTWAAYRRHLRRYEPVDDACRKAASAYVSGRRAARKAAQAAGIPGGTA